MEVVGMLESLCEECSDYLNSLPTFEKDTRVAALVTWCLAYSCEDYDTLPIYWHKPVGKKGPDAEAKAGWSATGEGWAISETSSKAGSAEVRSMQFPAAAML